MKRLARMMLWILLWGAATAAAADENEAKEKEMWEKGSTLAILCVNSGEPPKAATLEKSLEKWLRCEIKDLDIGKNSIAFSFRDSSAVILRRGKPAPKKEIKYGCLNAHFWEGAEKEMAKHRDHLVVTVLADHEERYGGAMEVSLIMAALSEVYETAGMFWGHASTVYEPKMFRKMLAASDPEKGRIPAMLWVGYLVERGDKGGLNCYTDGLSLFGLKEFEVLETKKGMQDTYFFLMGLAEYVMKHGDVIKDGDTVGPEEGPGKVKTRYADSAIGRDERVIRVEY